MLYRIVFFIVAGVALASAQVVISDAGQGRFHVEMEGKPFGDFYTGKEFPKPFFAPLRTASGKIVTREWPMVADSGTTRDHQHHRGLWLGYQDVNGTNFWENEFSYHTKNAGKIVAREVKISQMNEITGDFDWTAPSGEIVLTEHRVMTFRSEAGLRTINLDIVLIAKVQAAFTDDKDGALGVRMNDLLTEKATGVITDSEGRRTAKETWGKRADWCDYTGTLEGETVGLTMFEHPSSFHHPARWHVRDYGILAGNPFADHAYDPAAAVRHFTMKPGETVHLHFRIITHGELSRGQIEGLYKEYAGAL